MNKSTKTGYRLVELGKDGSFKTLFHGVKGSRTLPKGKWLTCERKIVHEGINGTKYISAFHVLPSLEECQEFSKIFEIRDNRRIISLKYRQFRPKRHSRGPVLLANRIFIPTDCEIYPLD
jgi:hypothetical protein